MSMGMGSGEDEELPKFSGSKASAAYLYRLRQVQMRHSGAAILILSKCPCRILLPSISSGVSEQLDCHMSS